VAPEQERRLVFAAVRRFLGNVAGPAGTLLVLDDLQWAGSDGLALFSTLARATAVPPLRVVGVYRDTEVGPRHPLAILLGDLAHAGLATQRTLAPLGAEDASRLLDALLAEQATPAGQDSARAREHVLQRAGGVPFFLVSCAQGLPLGTFDGEEATRCGEGRTAGIPWEVAQGVRQRMAALPAAAQEVLGAAAVVGRVASRAVLVTMSALPTAEVLSGLDAACRVRLLEEEGQDAYRFAHDIVREVVEADLGAARRTVWHHRVAEVLEELPGEPPVELLAYHYTRSDAADRAVPYLERAGDKAVAQSAHDAAEEYYRALVEGLDRLGRPLNAARAREKLGGLLTTVGRLTEALDMLDRAAARYQEVGDTESLGRVTALIGVAHGRQGAGDEGVHRLLPVVALLETCGPSSALTTLYNALALLLIHVGRYGEGLAAAERAAELAGVVGETLLLARAHYQRSVALRYVEPDGDVKAERVLEEAVQLAEAAGDLETLSDVLLGTTVILLLRGEFERSRVGIERALIVAERLGDPLRAAWLVGTRGHIATYAGRWGQARRDIEQSIVRAREVGAHWQLSAHFCALGQLCVVEGAWEEAAQHLEEAVALAGRFSIANSDGWAQRLLAELDLLGQRPTAAYARLIVLLDGPRRDEHDIAFLLPSLAWMHLQLGATAEASTVVTQAVAQARGAQNMLALADALRVQALVATEQARWEEATGALNEGLALTRRIRYPYAEARLLEAEGLLHGHKGEPAWARGQLAAALVIFRQLGARKHVEQAEQALAALPQA
jgi:tetratricopeptide (TPR) repeat protein